MTCVLIVAENSRGLPGVTGDPEIADIAVATDTTHGAPLEAGDRSSRSSEMSSGSHSRPPSLQLSGAGSKRSSREVVPLSPTGYEQPPTPDHPPPSPMTAVIGIQEKINPGVRYIRVDTGNSDFYLNFY